MNSNWADLAANLSEEHRARFEAEAAQGLWNIEAPHEPQGDVQAEPDQGLWNIEAPHEPQAEPVQVLWNIEVPHRDEPQAEPVQGLWNIEAPHEPQGDVQDDGLRWVNDRIATPPLRPYPPPSPPSPICVYDSTSGIHYCDFMGPCFQTANWDMLQYRVDIDYSWSCMGVLKICMFHRFCGRCQRDLTLVHPSFGVKMPGRLTGDVHKRCNWNACIDCFRWWNLHDNPNRDDITGADQININTFLDRWFGVTGPYANRLLDLDFMA